MKVVVAPWRWWTWLYAKHAREVMAGIALLLIASAALTTVNTRNIGQTNHSALVTQCENGNESREAARTLWNFVADLSEANQTSPEKAAFLAEFRAWVNQVYAAHDCSDLDKKYELPPPPTVKPTP